MAYNPNWLNPRGPTKDCEDVFVWMWYVMVLRLINTPGSENDTLYNHDEGERWQRIISKRKGW